MSSVIEAVRETSEKNYRALAERIAAGEKISPAKVQAALPGGRTLDDLQRDAERLTERRRALADLQRADRLKAQRKDIASQAAAKQAEASDILTEAQRRAAPIQAEAARLGNQATGMGSQARHLRQTACETLARTAGPEWAAELAGIRQQVQATTQQLHRLQNQQNTMVGQRSEEEATELSRRVQSAAARVAELELQLAAVERDLQNAAVSW